MVTLSAFTNSFHDLVAGAGYSRDAAEATLDYMLEHNREAVTTAKGQKQELARIERILQLANRESLPLEWADKMLRGNFDAASAAKAAQAEALRLGTRAPLLSSISSADADMGVTVGADLNRSTIADAIADALVLRAGRSKFYDPRGEPTRPHPRAEQLRGRSLLGLAYDFARAHAHKVPDLGSDRAKTELQKILWPDHGQPLGMHATGDFPYVLGAAMGKALTAEYLERPPQWPLWCNARYLKDFKPQHRATLGGAPSLAEVKEGDEYTQFTLLESEEQTRLKKWGLVFSLTWEAIVNDDLAAFSRLPRLLVTAARRLEDRLALQVLIDNAAMNDGEALFSAAHSNIAAGGDIGAPSVPTLNAMTLKTALMTGLESSEKLNLVPKTIVAPQALSGTIDALLRSEARPDVDYNSGVKNIYGPSGTRKLQTVYDAQLDAASPTGWYTACDPAVQDTVAVLLLEGEVSPVVEQVQSMSPDKRTFLVRHSVNAAAEDWRGLTYNAGA